ncbi:MAG: AAA family ATPase [Stenotrophomonas nitritireducens]|uniref:ATP-binding protein n=1 Tax=Stenotrophomonas nitritireducens TaxID=83617 RepID=UPI001ACA0076|nr:AAA family ATPase [Stenotrophomonas nitritireducens]MBN8794007.1 AAA family ATPase [Stenotrophomonas nitritireducens]
MMLKLSDEISNLEQNRGKYDRIFPGYITHIRFPRFKNIADGTRIDFSFPITALVGSNGSGKTSVLNALYGAPAGQSTGQYWFSTKVDPIEEGDGSPSRFIYGHRNVKFNDVVETRKARVRKTRNGLPDPNYWEPTKESTGDGMVEPDLKENKIYTGRSKDRWNPVSRKVLYINFRKELSAFDKYFYFGKDPVPHAPPKKGVRVSPLRISSKMDQVRHDAELLARVIDAGDSSYVHRGHKVATENRLLDNAELAMVSFVLGKEYEEARWIRHRLFKGDGGLSVVFKTKHGRYSEAFAGSGEVAVTSCVVQVSAAKPGTLVLLDEPEVSLHPGAQERLLAFLSKMARTRQLQVVFSTHSPHLVNALPGDAIKTFHQLDDGRFVVLASTHPYAAFRRLGAVGGGEVRILVEDKLARSVVQQALLTFADQAKASVFKVEYLSGGAEAILKYQVPVLMTAPGHTLVLLDGDKKRLDEFVNPDTIPVTGDGTLGAKILEAVGVEPVFTVDGGAGGGDVAQRVVAQRKYLSWLRKNVRFIPTKCPEELVLIAAGKLDPTATTAQHHKDRLRELTVELYGPDVSSERTDAHGETLLAQHRVASAELALLAKEIERHLP